MIPNADIDVHLLNEISRNLNLSSCNESRDEKSAEVTKMKRVLSCQLFPCKAKAADKNELRCKKKRANFQEKMNEHVDMYIPPLFSIGSAAREDEPSSKVLSLFQQEEFMNNDNLSSIDTQLRSELEGELSTENKACRPVPLLTPPSTPRRDEILHYTTPIYSSLEDSNSHLVLPVSEISANCMHTGLTPKLAGISVESLFS